MTVIPLSRAMTRLRPGSVVLGPELERLREPLARLIGAAPAARVLEKTGAPGIMRMPPDELAAAAGIPRTAAKRVVAARDLGLATAAPAPAFLKCAADVLAALPPGFATLEAEVLLAFALTANLAVKATVVLAKGSDIGTSIRLRCVFVPLVRLAAASFIIAHNHPSAAASPSPEDITMTRRIAEAGSVVGIELLDHLIVTPSGAVSLRDLWLISATSAAA